MTAGVVAEPTASVLSVLDRQAKGAMASDPCLPAEIDMRAVVRLEPEFGVPAEKQECEDGLQTSDALRRPAVLALAAEIAPGHGTPDTRFPSARSEPDLSHRAVEALPRYAQVEARDEQTEDQTAHEDQSEYVDRLPPRDLPPRRRSLMGHFALQFLDVQKLRVATQNRVHAMERDEIPEPWIVATRTVLLDLTKLEAMLGRQLEKQGRQHFMHDWIKQAPGISLAGFARLIGIVGPLENFATVSKLWAYCGYHVVNGKAPRRHKGEKANWSPSARVLCYQISESIVKVNRGPYREAYDRKKFDYELNRLDWTQAHRHEAAMRYAVKALLQDMWLEWRRQGHDVARAADAPAPTS